MIVFTQLSFFYSFLFLFYYFFTMVLDNFLILPNLQNFCVKEALQTTDNTIATLQNAKCEILGIWLNGLAMVG